ncbi:hypothetical protein J2128_001049 [Methanomicrobium sp. W14]|uniref:hypothetical protein n=1 Tax=Methanomicrobium sp. W14 TaxID=2817839 RepID=UPI001AE5F5B7|nr:hypothetical protein [Methanomicrobium sp. W14]MBP2133128.1 hypothetical protein [Methanomicrobium sp. W14]
MFTGAGTAASINVYPTSLDSGDTLTVDYSDIPDGSSFSLLIRGKLDVTPDSGYTMNINTFVIPFSLSSGTVSATADNSVMLSLNYEDSSGTIKTVTKYGDSENKCSISESQDVSAGTYDNMWVEGTSGGDDIVNTDLSFIGTKSGPDSGEISFKISGIEHAIITVICRVAGETVTNSKIVVGGGLVTSTPTETTSPSGGASGGGVFGAGGLFAESTETSSPEETYSPAGTISASGIAETADTVASSDKELYYAGNGAPGAVIMYDSADTVPPGWNILGKIYALISDGSEIKGNIYFRIPDSVSSENSDSLFVGMYKDGEWVKLSSSARDGYIVASVSDEGTFALIESGETVSSTQSGSEQSSEEGMSPLVYLLVVVVVAAVLAYVWVNVKHKKQQ